MGTFVKFKNVNKIYKTGDVNLFALNDVSFEIEKGEVCVILGQSGAGKTTLLNILGGMDTLTSGEVTLGDKVISLFSKRELTKFRREDIGFVFQFYNLIPNLTALENVEIVTQMIKDPLPADQVLKSVGLEDRLNNFPAQLSGGEQQRVAIARALAKNPKILLCDEPTGALDYETGRQILKLLQDQSRKKGMLVVIVTHNSALVNMADRVIRMRSGSVVSVDKNENALPIEEIEW
ncbi:MAG: ABC transporter ATP-binding protein [Clostridiales bacterium]|jgi:putative ABC transport system ATP-binding protein|nr:ABC transporter ATP-binding protein [Bacillota bacterium]NLK04534.1 ABC transporter ATP-binding protein [Clostridiales bacterium]